MFGIRIVKASELQSTVGNIIFGFYQFCGKDIRSIQIRNTNEKNVFLSTGENFKEETATKVTIPEDAIEEIIDINYANDPIYNLMGDTIEKPIDDKESDERFIFSDTKRVVIIGSKNIWSHECSTAMEAPNAYMVLKVFDKIKKILIENGIEPIWLEPLEETK